MLGAVDELRLHIVPTTLGAGERVFNGVKETHVRLRQRQADGPRGARDVTRTRHVIDRRPPFR